MTDMEAEFLKHLGNSFVPYIGREEGLPKPPELAAREREERERKQELRRKEEERRRKEKLEKERADLEALAKAENAPSEMERVIRAVCAVHGVTREELLDHNRRNDLVVARQHVTWLARTRLEIGWTEIGRIMQRDHGTIMTGYKRFMTALVNIPQVAEVNELLEEGG